MTHTGRTRTLLQALACHPEGMTTPQLAQAIGEASLPWQRALNKAGIAMREHERLGRRNGPDSSGPTGPRGEMADHTGWGYMAGLAGADRAPGCHGRPGGANTCP